VPTLLRLLSLEREPNELRLFSLLLAPTTPRLLLDERLVLPMLLRLLLLDERLGLL
jgi:hypothetical protein